MGTLSGGRGILLPLPTLVVVHQTDDAGAGDAPRHFFFDVLPSIT
jgi:hypothetical protein